MANGEWLGVVCQYHKEWIEIVKVYGVRDAEDIVQDMYLKLHKYAKPERIIRNGKLSKGYVYFTLKSIIAKHFQDKKIKSVEDFEFVDIEDGEIERKETLEVLNEKMDNEMSTWRWYDRKLFEIYRDTEQSYRELAKDTNISWVSIYNTIKNCKAKLKKAVGEDYEDYLNEDYERI